MLVLVADCAWAPLHDKRIHGLYNSLFPDCIVQVLHSTALSHCLLKTAKQQPIKTVLMEEASNILTHFNHWVMHPVARVRRFLYILILTHIYWSRNGEAGWWYPEPYKGSNWQRRRGEERVRDLAPPRLLENQIWKQKEIVVLYKILIPKITITF
jgi:hypothetical protein